MSDDTCAVKGCAREAQHFLPLENEKLPLCCECAHGPETPVKRYPFADCEAKR